MARLWIVNATSTSHGDLSKILIPTFFVSGRHVTAHYFYFAGEVAACGSFLPDVFRSGSHHPLCVARVCAFLPPETADFLSKDWFAALRVVEHRFELKDPAYWRAVGRIVGESLAFFPSGHLGEPLAPSIPATTFSAYCCTCNAAVQISNHVAGLLNALCDCRAQEWQV